MYTDSEALTFGYNCDSCAVRPLCIRGHDSILSSISNTQITDDQLKLWHSEATCYASVADKLLSSEYLHSRCSASYGESDDQITGSRAGKVPTVWKRNHRPAYREIECDDGLIMYGIGSSVSISEYMYY